MNDLTRAAQALSDDTRLRIINVVTHHECCVCEVMQALLIGQTRASRNLKILFDAGFLNQRIDGIYTVYSIKDLCEDDFRKDLLLAVRKKLRVAPLAQEDLNRLGKASRVGVISKSHEEESQCCRL